MRLQEYEVISTVLQVKHEQQYARPVSGILIVESTMGTSLAACVAAPNGETNPSFQGIEQEAIDDFVAVGWDKKMLEKNFVLPFPYSLVSEKTLREVIRNCNWSKFHESFPDNNGYFQFSRVGLNRNQTQALVSSYWGGGPLAARSELHYLIKRQEKWVIEVSKTMFMS